MAAIWGVKAGPHGLYGHCVGMAPDRYDELRREWIHNHWTWSEIQRARMEKLDIQIRRRYAAMILAAPLRRDDLPRNPLPARGHASPNETSSRLLAPGTDVG